MSTRTLELQEVLSNAFDYSTANMYTIMPGVIVTVHNNLEEMRVDVQPALNIRDVDGDESSPRPVIINVPFQLPVSDLGGLTFPIGVGCPVELRWTMRGLDKWKRGNGMPDTPLDLRKFDIQDCIATPGIYPSAMSKNSSASRTNAHDPNDVVLVHNIGTGNEVEIRLKQSGQVIVTSPSSVEVNCTDATINADTTTTINTGDLIVNGNTTVNGDANFNSPSFVIASGTYSMTSTGGATSEGTMEWDGSIVLNGIPIETHKHGGVQTGGDNTGNPIA
jgi:phage baseplate assembly protein gpV